MKILETLDSGLVTRWHTSPQMNRTMQNNASHSWGVCIIALGVAPHLVDKDFLVHALLHDCGERKVADVSSSVKNRMPELSAMLKSAEEKAILDLDLELPPLSKDQQTLLKLCDMLEAIIFILNFAIYPDQVDGWESAIDKASDLIGRLPASEDDVWFWVDTHINPILVDRKITGENGTVLQLLPF